MDVINLIPSDYEGDPHSAGGYAWQDLENRILGEDRIFDGSPVPVYEKIYAEYRDNYGDITITKDGGYFEELPTGEHITIARENLIALINGMWCGSATRYIYHGTHTPVQVRLSSSVLVDDGSPVDEPEHGVDGYCRKCHSYCWGDCEAN